MHIIVAHITGPPIASRLLLAAEDEQDLVTRLEDIITGPDDVTYYRRENELPSEYLARLVEVFDFDIVTTHEVDISVPEKRLSWAFEVRVEDTNGLTKKQAERVITERMGYDEDYGFPYNIEWRSV